MMKIVTFQNYLAKIKLKNPLPTPNQIQCGCASWETDRHLDYPQAVYSIMHLLRHADYRDGPILCRFECSNYISRRLVRFSDAHKLPGFWKNASSAITLVRMIA